MSYAKNYQNLEGTGQPFSRPEKKSNKKKWIIIGSIVAVLVLAAVGTVVGILVSKNNSKEESSSSSGSKSTTKGGSGGTGNSTFKKDPALRQAFYGMAYTPEGALIEFGCTNTLENTMRDIELISQLTKRVRLYGADCNQTAQVLEAIEQTGVDLEVFAAIYSVADDDHVAYRRQRDLIRDAIQTYGADHIAGITVGNEFMLNWVTRHNLTDVTGPIAAQGAAILVADIADTRAMLASLNLDKDIPVGNSDAGSFFAPEVMAAMDYGLSNVHAWFANTTAEGAAPWVFDFFQQSNVDAAALLPNNPRMYIAETGWPTKSSDLANARNGPMGSDASEPNLQVFMDNFVCQANDMGVGYFFFEMFDEEWKDIKFGGVEGWWGLFNKDRTMKDVVIPDCISP